MRLDVGDPVGAGQVVAQIEAQAPGMIDWRTQAGLRERAAATEAAMRGALAARDRSATALALARADLERSQELARQGFISEAAMETHGLTVRQRQQALIEAEMAADAARHEHAAARVALLDTGKPIADGQPRVSLPVRAPVKGQVLKVIQEHEAFVAAGTPLYEFGNVDSLEVVVDVLSQDAASLQSGMPARLSVDLGPPRLAARVRRVEPVARTRVSALGVEEQRVRVIVDFDPAPPSGIGDGWRVNASIITLAEPAATVVPNGALVRRGTVWQVYAIDAGRARIRVVEIAARNARIAWIRSGLSPGERVVVHPPVSLAEGMRIRALAGRD
jgi:HlyD family secretion protein